MNRMTIFSSTSMLLAVSVFTTAAQQDSRNNQQTHNEAMRACAKACSDCQRECDACATHCAHMVKDGKAQHLTTLMTCQDCAGICATAAQIVSRHGPFSGLICESCTDACARCAKECERFPDDAHMKRCAEECRKCEKACKDMLKHIGEAKRK